MYIIYIDVLCIVPSSFLLIMLDVSMLIAIDDLPPVSP